MQLDVTIADEVVGDHSQGNASMNRLDMFYDTNSFGASAAAEAGGREAASWYVGGKAVMDFTLAAAIAILAAPLIALTMVLVKLTSRGPMIYSQRRVGRGGRTFTIYKIRTMVQNSEAKGPQWSTAGDPRVTPLGRFLRDTHLDELPQLYNILRGDMSLIGPRPERPEFVVQLERAIPRYRQRLNVRPGVTGLAQVQLPPDTDLESVRRKLLCDLHYIEQLSWWLDLRILICTGLGLLGVSYATSRRLFRVPTLGESVELPTVHEPAIVEPVEAVTHAQPA